MGEGTPQMPTEKMSCPPIWSYWRVHEILRLAGYSIRGWTRLPHSPPGEDAALSHHYQTFYRSALLCKTKRQYLLNCKVSKYCLLALHGGVLARKLWPIDSLAQQEPYSRTPYDIS